MQKTVCLSVMVSRPNHWMDLAEIWYRDSWIQINPQKSEIRDEKIARVKQRGSASY